MIIGFVEIDPATRAVNTHRDSYLLDTLTVVSVRRPLLPGGVLFGAGIGGFGLAFGDLLYAHEIGLTLAAGALALGLGWQAGQLKLLSRDLRGTELSGVIWGRYAALNRVRRDIVAAMAGRPGKAGGTP